MGRKHQTIEPKIDVVEAKKLLKKINGEVRKLLELIPDNLRSIQIIGFKTFNKVYTDKNGEDKVYQYTYYVVEVNGERRLYPIGYINMLKEALELENALWLIRQKLMSINIISMGEEDNGYTGD